MRLLAPVVVCFALGGCYRTGTTDPAGGNGAEPSKQAGAGAQPGGPAALLDAGHRDSDAAPVATPAVMADGGLDAGEPLPDAAVESACVTTSTSTLDGVAIDFGDAPCVFTLREARAGVSTPYRLVVTDAVEDLVSFRADWGDCGVTRVGPLWTDESIAGAGLAYCRCDVGLCVGRRPPPAPLPVGTYASAFAWQAVDWFGESDYGNPKGEPFPPGDYLISITTNGLVGAEQRAGFEVKATLAVTIVE